MLGLRRAMMSSNTLTKPSILHFSTSPTSAYYDDLINSAGRNRDFATVKRLLNKRAAHRCSNTASTFNFISPDLSILDELLRHFVSIDKGHPRNCAYEYLIAHLSNLHETHKAVRVAGEMLKHADGANAEMFHPILNSTTKRQEMGEAWRVMDLMRHWRIYPNTMSYNYLLRGYCWKGDLGSAAGVMGRMKEEGLMENVKTYDALVLGACEAGRLDAALLLIRRMVGAGFTPVYSTYAHVIGGMCRDGFYGEAVEFVRSFRGRDPRVDLVNYGMLGARLISLRRFDEAKIVVQEMEDRNMPMEKKLRNFYQYHFVSS